MRRGPAGLFEIESTYHWPGRGGPRASENGEQLKHTPKGRALFADQFRGNKLSSRAHHQVPDAESILFRRNPVQTRVAWKLRGPSHESRSLRRRLKSAQVDYQRKQPRKEPLETLTMFNSLMLFNITYFKSGHEWPWHKESYIYIFYRIESDCLKSWKRVYVHTSS